MAQDTGSGAAEILHTATVVLAVVTLTALAALACILVTWATAGIVRRRRAHQQATLRSVKSDTQSGLAPTADFNSPTFRYQPVITRQQGIQRLYDAMRAPCSRANLAVLSAGETSEAAARVRIEGSP